MRLKHTVVVLLIAVVSTTTMPVTGQEEPLPAIQIKTTFEPVTPLIALAVEPIRDVPQETSLADAARANDYTTFDALYRETPMPAYAMLHELWTFSMTDPIGAFYGADTHARLARAYPGYARYIEEYRIVDSNGNVFYPTSETRAFLLREAILGTPSPAPARALRVQIAERDIAPRVVEPRVVAPRTVAPRTVASRTGTPASPPADTAASRRRAPVTEPPVPVQVPVPTPVPVQPPAQAAAPDAAASAGEDAGAPTNFGTRGIFLLLIGIFGIGILAMMLRAPSELPPSIMTPPAEPPAEKPTVEPLRRPTAATPPPTPPPTAGTNRASGSRG